MKKLLKIKFSHLLLIPLSLQPKKREDFSPLFRIISDYDYGSTGVDDGVVLENARLLTPSYIDNLTSSFVLKKSG